MPTDFVSYFIKKKSLEIINSIILVLSGHILIFRWCIDYWEIIGIIYFYSTTIINRLICSIGRFFMYRQRSISFLSKKVENRGYVFCQ